jgi:hypothetical protein
MTSVFLIACRWYSILSQNFHASKDNAIINDISMITSDILVSWSNGRTLGPFTKQFEGHFKCVTRENADEMDVEHKCAIRCFSDKDTLPFDHVQDLDQRSESVPGRPCDDCDDCGDCESG